MLVCFVSSGDETWVMFVFLLLTLRNSYIDVYVCLLWLQETEAGIQADHVVYKQRQPTCRWPVAGIAFWSACEYAARAQ